MAWGSRCALVSFHVPDPKQSTEPRAPTYKKREMIGTLVRWTGWVFWLWGSLPAPLQVRVPPCVYPYGIPWLTVPPGQPTAPG